MAIPDSFRTGSLAAERLRPSHVDDLCRMHRDAAVMAGMGGTRTDEETKRFLETNLEHWDRYGHGLWVFRIGEKGDFAGRGGLRHVDVEGTDEVEIAYALMRDYWRRGLATEMAKAMLRIAFEDLERPDVVGLAVPENAGSRRVLEKAGFRLERDIVFMDEPSLLYRLHRDDWRRLSW
jgi:RimJ/RimL family protein N-acetyltransferase